MQAPPLLPFLPPEEGSGIWGMVMWRGSQGCASSPFRFQHPKDPPRHILCNDGCFYGNGMFRVAPLYDLKKLEKIFQHQVLKMLLKKGKITKDMIAMLSNWRHSGFNVFCGPRIQPGDAEAMENLARYIIRASFSQESPPWCDPFACHNSKQCIISNMALQLVKIVYRSGPGNDLYPRGIQGCLQIKR
jgi:hypothetical protein